MPVYQDMPELIRAEQLLHLVAIIFEFKNGCDKKAMKCKKWRTAGLLAASMETFLEIDCRSDSLKMDIHDILHIARIAAGHGNGYWKTGFV